MNDRFPNEVEERRVIRLLAGVGDDLPPLSRREVDALLRTTPGSRARLVRRRPLARRLRQVTAAAAAAAVVVSGSLALTASQPQGSGTDSGPGAAAAASFPEGSALRLLLQSNGGRS